MTDKYILNTFNYPFKSWIQHYPNCDVNIQNLTIFTDWNLIFNNIFNINNWNCINTYLSNSLKKNCIIYPYPENLFAPFNYTSFNDIKVVFIGQDPYFSNEIHNNKIIPQAMGLAFSVPNGMKIPSSLKNIFKNLKKFGHTISIPKSGNLISWAFQGCLMINASLTVQHGHKNSHAKIWSQFTDQIIKYISDNLKNIVFVLWGIY